MAFPLLDAGGRLHHAHDAGARHGVITGQGADRFPGVEPGDHLGALFVVRAGWAAQGLALCLRPGQAGLCALDQQVTLHFRDCGQHGQHQLAGGAGQVQLTELQHDNFDAARGQRLDRGTDVLGITAEAVQLGHDERFAVPDLAQHLGELRALGGRDLARHAFVSIPVSDRIAGGLDFAALVLRCLAFRADPTVSKSCHADIPLVLNGVQERSLAFNNIHSVFEHVQKSNGYFVNISGTGRYDLFKTGRF